MKEKEIRESVGTDMKGILTNWDVVEETAFALLVFTVDFLCFHIVKIVLLVAMAAKALTSRSNRFTIRTSLHVPPMDIQSVLSLLSDTSLIFLKLLLTHHLAAVVDANNLLVLDVGLDMFSSHAIHM